LKSVFLDTCIFFECIEDSRKKTIISHAIHLGFSLVTSIPVMGEAVDQMRKRPVRSELILSFINLYEEWNVATLYPDQVVARICNCMANREIDFRVEKTDRVHIGYAMSNGCTYFLPSDKNLIKYRVPKLLEDAGFFKPETLTLEEFTEYLN